MWLLRSARIISIRIFNPCVRALRAVPVGSDSALRGGGSPAGKVQGLGGLRRGVSPIHHAVRTLRMLIEFCRGWEG